MTEKQFVKTYCHNCGTQRCEGIGTEWFEGCKYKWSLDGMEIEATSEINKLEQQNLALATKIMHLQEQISKEEVKRGEWKHSVVAGHIYDHHLYTCSLCGAGAFTPGYEKYCHECGAKMDGGNAK